MSVDTSATTLSTGETAPTACVKPWDMQADETNVWYDRFWSYLMLGAARTVEECYRVRCEQGDRIKGDRATGYWYRMARQFNWEERAAAYDQFRREEIQRSEEERRLQERERRRGMVSEVLDSCYAAIKKANLGGMEEAEARRVLPTLRALFHDVIEASRLEMGEPTVIDQVNEQSSLAITADDLARAQQELMQMYGALPTWKGGAGTPVSGSPESVRPVYDYTQ